MPFRTGPSVLTASYGLIGVCLQSIYDCKMAHNCALYSFRYCLAMAYWPFYSWPVTILNCSETLSPKRETTAAIALKATVTTPRGLVEETVPSWKGEQPRDLLRAQMFLPALSIFHSCSDYHNPKANPTLHSPYGQWEAYLIPKDSTTLLQCSATAHSLPLLLVADLFLVATATLPSQTCKMSWALQPTVV